MAGSKGIQEEMRNKVTDICQSKAITKAFGLQWTMVRAIIHNWRKQYSGEPSPAVGGRQKWPKGDSDDSSRRWQRNPRQHLKNCMSHSPQSRSVFVIQQWSWNTAKNIHGWHKIASRVVLFLRENIPQNFGGSGPNDVVLSNEANVSPSVVLTCITFI